MNTKRYRMYVDEVGNDDLSNACNENHRYLNLTGLIVEFFKEANDLHDGVMFLKNKYFPGVDPATVIFHRKEIVNRLCPFDIFKDIKLRNEFNYDFLSFLSKSVFTIIAITIDKKEHLSRYKDKAFNPYYFAIELMLERYFKFLEKRRSVGDILIESRGKSLDRKLDSIFNDIYNGSWGWYIKSAECQKFLTSKKLKFKDKKSNISGLQVCDLIAYPIWRFMLDRKKRRKIDCFNIEVMKVVKDKFDKNQNGRTWGCGLKWFP